MGVAPYGTAALWSADPAFAAEAEIRRHSSSYGAGGDAGGGGVSCGGGGGCGG